MNLDIVRRAFESRVKAFADARSIKVEYENVAFDEPQALHLRTFLLPAQQTSETLDRKHLNESGIFQVSVVVLAGTGTADSSAMAKLIAELFNPQLQLAQDGLLIDITDAPSIAPGISEPSRYVVPISIPFRLDTSS